MESKFTNLDLDTFAEGKLRMSGRKGPRRREALSCSECRLRKGRCDRTLPCQPCQARGLTCSYQRAKRQLSQVARQPPVAAQASRSIAEATYKASEVEDTTAYTQTSTCPSPIVGNSARSLQQLNQTPDHGKGSLFRGSGLSTRLMGVSNWMACANDMPITKALLDRSNGFESCKAGFADLQALFESVTLRSPGHSRVPCAYNAQDLRALLPQRELCEKWAAHYNRTYGRIYSIVDPTAIVADMDRIFSTSQPTDEPVHVLRVMLVVAIGSWHVDLARDAARGLVRQAEDCIYLSTRFQKPCVGVVQTLLLLMLMKTIKASESDRMHDLLTLRGLTHQIVISMGLHRDPVYFTDVTPYYAEVRRRLWWCYMRLDLDYCFRSGTPLTLRFEDCDCPFPTLASLDSYKGHSGSRSNPEDHVENDDHFGVISARLATAIASAIQALSFPSPHTLIDVKGHVRSSLDDIVSGLPEELRIGHPTTDYMQIIQQTTIAINVQSVKLSFALALILGRPPDAAMPSRELLLDTWDQAICILQHFQAVCQGHPHNQPEIVSVAHHVLWADACRATLAACLVVNCMREAHLRHTIIPNARPPPTMIALQQLLLQYVESLDELFEANCHLGMTAAETRVLFAVITSMTRDASTTLCGPDGKETFFANSVSAAEKAIADIKQKPVAGGDRLIAFPEQDMLSGILSRPTLSPSPFSWPNGPASLREPDFSLDIDSVSGFMFDNRESSVTANLGFDFPSSPFQKATGNNFYLEDI